MYTIYIIRDHKFKPYIGMTSKTAEKRLYRHKRYAKRGVDTHLYNAMRKYGVEKFEVVPLVTGLTKEKACKLEKVLIKLFDSREGWGYNMIPGGEGAPGGEDHPMHGKKHSNEVVAKMSEAVQGEDNPMYGREHTEGSRKKIKMALKGRSLSGEHCEKIGKSMEGEDNHMVDLSDEEVIQAVVEYRITDKTQKEVSKEYGVSEKAVSQWHSGDRRPYLQEQVRRRIPENAITPNDNYRVKAVVEYRTTDKSQKEVANEYGLSARALGSWHRGSKRSYLQEEIKSRLSEK